MPARVNFKVEALGVNQAIADLGRVEGKKFNQVIDVINKSAAKITAGAKERCPVDTGRLRASIAMRPSRGGLEIEVGTNVEYAPFVEFGTTRMAARPFLFPAFHEEQSNYLSQLRKVLNE